MTPIPLDVLAAAAAKAKAAGKQKAFVTALIKASQPPPANPESKDLPGRCQCTTMGYGVWDWEFWAYECWRPLEPGECGQGT